MLNRFLKNRKGTAEVIGTIMFVMILLFFFTNVYIWHDQAVKQMNELNVKKMSAGMEINPVGQQDSIIVTVKATGSEVTLSRLWIDSSNSHVYANLEPREIQVDPGDVNAINFTFSPKSPNSDGSGGLFVTFDYTPGSNNIIVYYSLPQDAKFTIVNTLGIAISSS